jgi:hypothetical protein
MHRLEHVVERVHLEGFNRMLVMCRHEHDWRHSIRTDRADDVESVEFRHLYVEEHKVGAERSDAIDCGLTVATLGDDLDVAAIFEERSQVPPGDRFIVDDDGADPGVGHAPTASRGQRGSVWYGIWIRTANPPSARGPASKRWRAP